MDTTRGGGSMIRETAWAPMGEALGLSAHLQPHLTEACSMVELGPGETIRMAAGAPCADWLWVAEGTVRVHSAPGITCILSASARSLPFLLPSRSHARVTARDPSRLVQVNGAALAHLRAWDRLLAEQRAETRRRVAAIRQPLWLAGVAASDLPMLIDSMEVVEVPDARDVVREGRPCDQLFLIDSGSAEVWRQGTRVGEITTGQFFPECVLDHRCCDATVRTRGAARLLTLFRGDLKALRAWGTRRPEVCLA